MTDVRLAALLDAVPQRSPSKNGAFDPGSLEAWVAEQLGAVWPQHAAELAGQHDNDDVFGWAVGSVVGNETLVQSRPVVRDGAGAFLSDFLRAEARGTLAALVRMASGRPDGAGIARYHRWVGVTSHFDALQSDRDFKEVLTRELPDFLLRARQQQTLTEVLLFSFLRQLHVAGELGSAYANPAEIRKAMANFEARIADGGHEPVNLLVFDGRTFAAGLHHGRMFSLHFDHGNTGRRSLVHGTAPASNLLALLDDPPPEAALSAIADGVELEPGVFSIDPRSPGIVTR